MHCFDILGQAPKWMDYDKIIKEKTKQRALNEAQTANSNVSTADDGLGIRTEDGVKKLKAKLKADDVLESIAKQLDVVDSSGDKLSVQLEEQNTIAREKLDFDIMTIDLKKVDDAETLVLLKLRRTAILNKYKSS
jgi:hypothetical protein